jgi:hypothetical protein
VLRGLLGSVIRWIKACSLARHPRRGVTRPIV